jgi:hypothetical protein
MGGNHGQRSDVRITPRKVPPPSPPGATVVGLGGYGCGALGSWLAFDTSSFTGLAILQRMCAPELTPPGEVSSPPPPVRIAGRNPPHPACQRKGRCCCNGNGHLTDVLFSPMTRQGRRSSARCDIANHTCVDRSTEYADGCVCSLHVATGACKQMCICIYHTGLDTCPFRVGRPRAREVTPAHVPNIAHDSVHM